MEINIDKKHLLNIKDWLERHGVLIVAFVLTIISIISFIYYLNNGLGLAYNDARSHLDIGRRVVEGLKPGMAQLGSVWLPLTHFLMIITIWNDFMWHSGLAGALWSMIAFVGTGILIFKYLKELNIGLFARFTAVAIFVANINILYLQSTAMTELVLLFTMTAGAYFFMLYFKRENILHLLMSALWIMLSTLVRYDGWFMFVFAIILLFVYNLLTKGYKKTEGIIVLFCSLAGLGVVLWLLWNALIFDDPLYFIFGPFSAHAQQEQLDAAGVLATKNNWFLSAKTYFYAMAYNSGALTMFLGAIGAIALWLNRKTLIAVRVATVVLFAPLAFNVLALYFGHSVLFVPDLFGTTWFNVRYGIMMMPSFAIFIGWLIDKLPKMRIIFASSLIFVAFFSFVSADAVTLDDALTGSSQKNVDEVGDWLRENTSNKDGLILISVASHDSIIFTSGLPMKKFIHEGTGLYYKEATDNPQNWARWIIMRSYSDDDSTWRKMWQNPGFDYYELADHYPFADIYALKDEYLDGLIKTEDIKDAFKDKEDEYRLDEKDSGQMSGKKRIDSAIEEAEEVFNNNSWVEMSEEGKNTYDSLMRDLGSVDLSGVDMNIKYSVAWFIEHGSALTEDLNLQERGIAIEEYASKNQQLPNLALEWQELIYLLKEKIDK